MERGSPHTSQCQYSHNEASLDQIKNIIKLLHDGSFKAYIHIKVAQNFSAFRNQIKNGQTFPEEQKKTD